MANRQGIYHSKRRSEVKPQYLVTEAKNHPNGFTVYKVICREADPDSFDCYKESFVWKRYSDFKELYKYLVTLHRKLYLNGRPPDFAKPKLFGRFEESVVNERKQSAEDVLNFATEHPPLYKSAPFKEFFQALQPVDSTIEIKYLKQAPLKPSKDKRKSSSGSENPDQSGSPTTGLTERDLELFDPCLSTKAEFIASTSTNQDEDWIEEIKRNFTPSQPAGHSFSHAAVDAENDLQLLEDLKVSVTQTDLENYYNHSKPAEDHEQSLATLHENDGLDCEDARNVARIVNKNMDVERLNTDIDAREQHRKSSKASAYLEAVIRRNRLQSENGDSESKRQGKSEQFNNVSPTNMTVVPKLPTPKFGTSPTNNTIAQERTFFGMATRSSLLDLPKMLRDDGSDDESKGAYVTQAAQQISFARVAENKLAYEEAFGHYKAAINTLLQGVQGDTNEARIQAVRRKTANYLKRAEDIHSSHLKTTMTSSDLWKQETDNQPSSSPRSGLHSIDTQRIRRNTSSPIPAVPSPRHSSKDLSCYKVLGAVGKVLLVLDTRSNETYVLKILLKSCQNRLRKGVIPTNVPFMVRLHRYYSTEHAVCLLLEHATGGRLWDHLASYFEISHEKNGLQKPGVPVGILPRDMKCEMSSTPKKQVTTVPPQVTEEQALVTDQKEEGEENCSASFLDLCMEYKTLENGNPAIIATKEPVRPTSPGDLRDSAEVVTVPTEDHKTSPQHRSISEAIEDPGIGAEEENNTDFKKSGTVHQNPSDRKPEQAAIKRTWSYLSWDDGAVVQPETAFDVASAGPSVFDSVDASRELENNFDERTSFKTIASQGDPKLFTIGQENDPEPINSAPAQCVVEDPLEDSIYDSRSNEASEGDDSGDELPDPFTHELLSEQDMSAVSLLGENMEKTLQARLVPEGSSVPGGSPVLARVAGTLRGSPCLSMNSSFEEDSVTAEKNEDGDPGQTSPPVVTRVVDENGVSSVDAVSLFRTHSRTRSTASISETKSPNHIDVLERTDETDGPEREADNVIQVIGSQNKVHSIFVDMDVTKERNMSYRIPESSIRKWSAEIVVAVGTLHSIAILCRDLNPNNILLSTDGHIRLSYFGKWRQVERKPCDKFAVERMYAAPEMTRVDEKKTEACDWWSVGALLYELMTGQPLYLAHPSGISSHTVLSLPDDLSPEAKSLLSALLQYHPTQRLGYGMKGLDDLMAHPFFNGIEWDFLIENYVAS